MSNSEIRAACIQILFSAVFHLKLAIFPYSNDLLKVAVTSLREGLEKVLIDKANNSGSHSQSSYVDCDTVLCCIPVFSIRLASSYSYTCAPVEYLALVKASMMNSYTIIYYKGRAIRLDYLMPSLIC